MSEQCAVIAGLGGTALDRQGVECGEFHWPGNTGFRSDRSVGWQAHSERDGQRDGRDPTVDHN
ncbi:hypothetical protein MNVM_06650 [Mycobacterium novum]|uniref:Uncharacterized protein n=1 Tax=Mycobacterium novum TaxID=2492438 RepID=A0A7I7JJW6_9MYCO|nr:hypothetical protein MNVM_06650 [Mycobacterium novum]